MTYFTISIWFGIRRDLIHGGGVDLPSFGVILHAPPPWSFGVTADFILFHSLKGQINAQKCTKSDLGLSNIITRT